MRLLHAFLVSLLCALALPVQAQSFSLGPRYDDLEARLRLNPTQKQQFDVAKGATQRAILSIGLVALEIKARLATELAKDRPDFESLARDPDALVAQVRPHFREARDEWARLYALMDDDQVAIARAYMDQQFAQLEKIGVDLLGFMRERLRP
jgi:hypothetical protein